MRKISSNLERKVSENGEFLPKVRYFIRLVLTQRYVRKLHSPPHNSTDWQQLKANWLDPVKWSKVETSPLWSLVWGNESLERVRVALIRDIMYVCTVYEKGSGESTTSASVLFLSEESSLLHASIHSTTNELTRMNCWYEMKHKWLMHSSYLGFLVDSSGEMVVLCDAFMYKDFFIKRSNWC